MKEKHFQTEFGHFLQRNILNLPGNMTAVYELKICKQKSIRFDRVKDHQILALLKAKTKWLYHKITDMPHFEGMKTRFDAKKPFDCFTICRASAWIVIWPYVKNQRKGSREMIFIDVEEWLKVKRLTEGKSIKVERLKSLGHRFNF